ncbi:MAG: hypothetical protein V1494_06665 [Candidatus Diapherotrites archaeon]
MKGKGQLTLDAVMMLAFFCAVLALFGNALLNANENIIKAGDAVSAKAEAEKCSLVIDLLFASGSGELTGFQANCFLSSPSVVSSTDGNSTANSAILNNETQIVQAPGGITIAVGGSHYAP